MNKSETLKAQHRAASKKYYENNKKKVMTKQKEIVICPECCTEYTKANKAIHLNSKIHIKIVCENQFNLNKFVELQRKEIEELKDKLNRVIDYEEKVDIDEEDFDSNDEE